MAQRCPSLCLVSFLFAAMSVALCHFTLRQNVFEALLYVNNVLKLYFTSQIVCGFTLRQTNLEALLYVKHWKNAKSEPSLSGIAARMGTHAQ